MKKNALSIILFFIVLCLTIGGVFAQKQGQALLDSLLTALPKAVEDTNKLNLLNNLSANYSRINPDEGIKYGQQEAALAEKLHWKKGIAMANGALGINSLSKADYQKALEYDFKALKMFEELDDKNRIATSIGNIGNVYSAENENGKALENYLKALKIYEETGNKNRLAVILGNIGSVYQRQRDYQKALEYDLKSLKIKEEVGNKLGIANAYNNIGLIYESLGNYSEALKNYFASLKINEELGIKANAAFNHNNIGNIYKEEGNYEEALKSQFAALKIDEEIGNKNDIAACYSFIGFIYLKQNKYKEALKNQVVALKLDKEMENKPEIASCYVDIATIYLKQENYSEALKNYTDGKKIFEQTKDKHGLTCSYQGIGDVYSAMGNYAQALPALNNALNFAKDINEKDNEKNTYFSLAEVYQKLNNYKKAYECHQLYSEMKDSLLNEASGKQITEMKTKYETEKKDNEIQLLNKDKEVQTTEIKRQTFMKNGFIGGFAVVMLFAGVFFTQRNRITRGKKRSDELLLNILPSETAEELKATGSAKAKSYDMVTVLFTDFKNFTQASENMNAEELVNEIHHCYSEFDKIISKHGIEKIKTIGDSYMCAGGLPVENKTNPVEVVRAALEIQQFIAREKEERQKSNKPFFEIRIGINTGPVVAGIVGIKKFAYDIWGDTVNIASRMESSGEVGKVNISGSTYELVKDKFICNHRGKIDAKNKGMIDMYFVDGEKA